MPSSAAASPLFARLSARARVVAIADSVRHVHALRRLRHFFCGWPIQLVETNDLASALPPLQSDPCDLMVVLSDSSPPAFADQAMEQGTEPMAADAFRIRTQRWRGQPLLSVMGGGRPGLIHAVNELGMRHLIAREDSLELPVLDLYSTPALPYRLLWTWDHSTNWYLEQVGIQEIGALNYYSKPRTGFLEDYRRLVDFMSLHRISGVTIYGFLRDNHGGVEAAQELCRYAAERGVRILPGVGINAYGGIYWEGDHPYNLTQWLRRHPELRAVFDRPVAFHIPDMPELWFPETHYTDAACPSRPENARYHEEAIQWLAETFDIGGINFETGDYGVCRCDECRTRRNDDATWSHRDMEMLYPRLFAAARRGRADLWLVCEAYWDNLLDLERLTPLAGLPEDAIYQFCINRSYWPHVRDSLTREHVARLPRPHNIVRTHMGSQWNHERYELVADRFAELMQLMHRTGMEGATIFGEVSAFSTVNEINYLAFARFGYQAGLTWEHFVSEDLGPLFGGTEAAQRYLALLRVPPQEKALRAALGEAGELAASQTGDVHRRWVWLQNRLYQKLMMLDPQAAQCASVSRPAVDSGGTPASLRGSETLLLVDDEKLIVDAVGRILRDCGYEVLEANDPESALMLLQTRAQDVRVLVTDLMMPGMSGHTLIARSRQIAPGLRAVVMSGVADATSDAGNHQAPDVCFVSKPFSVLTLLSAIRSLLDDSSHQI